jgi:hypothetical protein
MKLIKSKKEFGDYYYYKSPLKEQDYPKRYPCIVEQIHHDGGLGGCYVEHKITYFPENVDQDSFLRGFIKGRELI